MTDVHVGPAPDNRRFLQTDLLTWFAEPVDEPVDESLSFLPEDGRFAAQVQDGDPDRYAGVYGVLPVHVTVPGPLHTLVQVPVAGLTWVGVHPDERRRGVLTAMLRDHFTRTGAARGSGLSALHASEPAIYGRHGYGIASWNTMVTLSRGTTLTAPGLDAAAGTIRTRLVDADDPAVVRRVHEIALRVGAARLGSVVVPEQTTARFLRDVPAARHGHEPGRVLFAQRDGVDVGCALMRRKPEWKDGRPQGTVHVGELLGDPAAELALARRLVDLDLTSSVEIRERSVDDLLVQWAGGPRSVLGPAVDSLWLRLVDLPRALTTRGYAAPCDVLLGVTDHPVPENDGTWRLTVSGDGTAEVTRTNAEPEVRLATEVLATAYLGGRSLLTPWAAGQLVEARPGAIAELDAAMRMPTAPIGASSF